MSGSSLQSYCIIHPSSSLNDPKFQYDSKWVKIEVPTSDSSGDPYLEEQSLAQGAAEEDVIYFDNVFAPNTSQDQVFGDVAHTHVRAALTHFRSAMFIASGATGSGKTFAITGGAQSWEDRGLIPRSVTALFEALASISDKEDVEISVSFYELYKDAVIDLLSERRRKVPIRASEGGPVLVGLLRQVVANQTDALHLLFQGDSNRHFQNCALNSESSRGHAVYLVQLIHRLSGHRSMLAFVDLAAPAPIANPANTAVTQSLDALKAALLCQRDGRERSWDSNILPQLLECWLSPAPGQESSVVLLTPVRYSLDTHQESHEWLNFARLVQEAHGGKPLRPSTPMKTTWAQKKGLQVPESFKMPSTSSAEEPPTSKENKEQPAHEQSPPRHDKARSAILTAIQMLSKDDERRGQESLLVQDATEPVLVQAVRPSPAPDGHNVPDQGPAAPGEMPVQPPVGCQTPMQPPPAPPKAASPNQTAYRRFVVAPPMLPTVPATQASTPIIAARVVSPLHRVSPGTQVAVPAGGSVSPCRPLGFCEVRQATSPPPRSVSPCRPVAATPPMMRPSTLAVQQQQHEMQQLQSNLRRPNLERASVQPGPRAVLSRSQSPQQGIGHEIRTASPIAVRALGPGPGGAAWPKAAVPGAPVAYMPRAMSPTPIQASGQPRTESPLPQRAGYPVMATSAPSPPPARYAASVVQMRPAVCAGAPGTPTLVTRVPTPRQQQLRREVPAAIRIAAPIFGVKEATVAPARSVTPRKPAAVNSAEPAASRQFTPAPAGTMERVIVRSGTRS